MNDMTRYTMPARSQGNAFMQRTVGRLAEKDVHRWVFVHDLAPEVEQAVRKWLLQRQNGFYCDLQATYAPHMSVYGWPFCLGDLNDTGGVR